MIGNPSLDSEILDPKILCLLGCLLIGFALAEDFQIHFESYDLREFVYVCACLCIILR